MSVGKVFKDVFNWMAAKPSHQYTLGGDSHSIKFNRAARLVERMTTIPAVAVGAGIAFFGLPAAAVGNVPASASALTVGLCVAAFGKAAGLVKGGLTHLVAKGLSSLANHVSRPAAPAQG